MEFWQKNWFFGSSGDQSLAKLPVFGLNHYVLGPYTWFGGSELNQKKIEKKWVQVDPLTTNSIPSMIAVKNRRFQGFKKYALRTDGRMDRPFYRDAWKHLKRLRSDVSVRRWVSPPILLSVGPLSYAVFALTGKNNDFQARFVKIVGEESIRFG